MSNSDLKYVPINHGGTSYNERAIERVRARSQGNKAHIQKTSPFKRLVYKVAFAGLIVVSVIGVSLVTGYRGEIDKNNITIQDTYVDNLGTIMENYSESQILEIANEVIAAATKMKGPDAEMDINGINESLAKIALLKAKDKNMSQEISWQLRSILSIASRYDIFLPGYNYDLPSFPEYVGDKVKSIFP
jgi:hypothetical protein